MAAVAIAVGYLLLVIEFGMPGLLAGAALLAVLVLGTWRRAPVTCQENRPGASTGADSRPPDLS
jgi:membrane-bound ClpP family serine protease